MPKVFSGGFERFGNFDVFFTRIKTSVGVVMGHDDGRSTVGNGIGKDLTWMDLGFVDQTDGDDPAGNHFVCAIQGNTPDSNLTHSLIGKL